MNKGYYILKDKDSGLFYSVLSSNWTDYNNATKFSSKEKSNFLLPEQYLSILGNLEFILISPSGEKPRVKNQKNYHYLLSTSIVYFTHNLMYEWVTDGKDEEVVVFTKELDDDCSVVLELGFESNENIVLALEFTKDYETGVSKFYEESVFSYNEDSLISDIQKNYEEMIDRILPRVHDIEKGLLKL